MVGNDHQMAAGEIGVDGAGSIGQDQSIRAETADDSSAECHLGHCVSFVVMNAAFEDDDTLISDLAEDNLSAMPWNFRERKVGNGDIVDSLRPGQDLVDSR